MENRNDKIRKTVIITGYSCNNYCLFCMNKSKRGMADRPTGDLLHEILQARLRGTTYLEIIGGEQTIRPDILKIIGYAKELGFSSIVMATNGRMFSYKKFADKIFEAGLTDVIFSVHGHNSRLFDSLTQGKGSFAQLLKGIENVKKLGVKKIGSNTTIVKPNYKFLPEIARFISGLGVRNSEFIFVDPTRGGALEDFDLLVPRISEAASYIRDCLDVGRNNGAVHWHIRYVPLCYFEGYEDQISELHENEVFQNTEHIAQDYRNFNVLESRARVGRIKPAKCNGCSKYDICEGLWMEYYNRYGDKELKPIN